MTSPSGLCQISIYPCKLIFQTLTHKQRKHEFRRNPDGAIRKGLTWMDFTGVLFNCLNCFWTARFWLSTLNFLEPSHNSTITIINNTIVTKHWRIPSSLIIFTLIFNNLVSSIMHRFKNPKSCSKHKPGRAQIWIPSAIKEQKCFISELLSELILENDAKKTADALYLTGESGGRAQLES